MSGTPLIIEQQTTLFNADDRCRIARVLDEWAASRSLYLPLNTLKGWSVGIDASYYLYQHLHHPATREPLLIALGGFPFALRANIERELQTLKSLGIECVFVFDGLDFGYKDSPRQARAESSRAFEQAWELYDQQQAEQVVDSFSNAGRVPGLKPRISGNHLHLG